MLDLPPRPLPSLDPGLYRLSANSILRFEYQPNHRPGGPPFEEGHETFEINSWGFRDREFSAHHPGVTRIVVLGDSVTAGLGVADVADTYPKVLERLLGGSTGRVEVLNLGVGGYDTEQEAEALRVHIDRLRPDVVCVGFCVNDFSRVDGGLEDRLRDLERERPRTTIARFVSVTRSRFLFFLYHRIGALVGGVDSPPERPSNADKPAPPSSNVSRGLAALSALQDRYGFRAVIFIIPAFDRPFSDYRHAAIHLRLQRLAAEHRNLTVVDLLDLLAPLDALAPQLSRDGLHPGESGHALIASAMCRSLVSLHWVGAAASACGVESPDTRQHN